MKRSRRVVARRSEAGKVRTGKDMSLKRLRIGIVGWGLAARTHLERLAGLDDVLVVGCADGELAAAEALAAIGAVPVAMSRRPVAFSDHRELLKQTEPGRPGDLHPHLAHYRPAMDALQAGCHVFIEKPLSTNVQEAVDIVGLARAADARSGSGTSTGSVPASSRRDGGWRRGRSGRSGWCRRCWPSPGWRRTPGRRTPGGSTRTWPAAGSWPTRVTT